MNPRHLIFQMVFSAVSLAWGGLAGVSVGGEPVEPAHMSWVRQLGASSYANRHRAANKLLEIGIEAKPALMRGIREQDDLEVRLEAHRLLVRILQNRFDARLVAFLNDEDFQGASEFPGWRRFREKLGDSRLTRCLYADMLRAENDLLGALSQDGGSLDKHLTERFQSLPHGAVSEATLATLLFLATQPGQERTEADQLLAASHLYSILRRGDIKEVLLQGEYALQLKQLLVGWIEGAGESRQQGNLVRLALEYDLDREGVGIARKILNDPDANSTIVPYAAIMLGRFGTKKDVKHLRPHLNTTKVFHTWSNRQLKKEPIRIQVRDAVLAMIIRLHDEDPAAYGFKLLKSDDKTLYKIYTLGFLGESQRDAAIAKWNARSKAGEPSGEGRDATDANSGQASKSSVKEPAAPED
ncbi:MAG: hypothetical protein ACODAD_03885 [Planctomycetota bacterium]